MGEQNYKAFWDEALKQIQEEYKADNNEQEFLLWYNLDYVEDSISEITVEVPSAFMWNQITNRGNIKRIEEKIYELSGKKITLKNVIKSKTKESEKQIPKNNSMNETSSVTSVEPEKTENFSHPQLNPDFTFENFVPGENSVFAYNVCLKVSKNPGKEENPVMLYGGSGLGKTHLMQSIGNSIFKKNPKLKIEYITAEDFTNEFIQILKNKNTESFKKKYRNLDVLLLDDVQFLGRTDQTQEELFHTFNALYNKKKQMIFTCDRPITEVKGIEERLSTRFKQGFYIDLQPPNFETRKAILNRKLEVKEKYLREEIIDLIAKTIQSNVRDLEGSLSKIVGYQEFFPNKEITVEKAKELLTGLGSQKTNEISIEKIQQVVANHYNLTVADLKSKKRDAKIANPRHVAIYIAREITEASFPDLGTEFGGRDHTTIMSSHEKITNLMKIDSTYKSTIQMLIRQCKEI